MSDHHRSAAAVLRLAPAESVTPPLSLPSSIRTGAVPWTLVSAALYLGVALAVHFVQLGNPVLHVDEEFYLLVAHHMREGAVPFIDIWDRKPPGLFLLYRLFLLLPGDGVLTYQLCGIAACAGTALVIERLAQQIAGPASARLAGLAYVLFMPVFCYGIGQAPVFYNLLVALAAVYTLQAWRSQASTPLLINGAKAMALIGLAIQIKYTVVFEGAGFGLALLLRGHAMRMPTDRLLRHGLAWCSLALAPTLAVFAAYAAFGHAELFLQSNVFSIMLRRADGMASWNRLASEMLALTPFWIALGIAARTQVADSDALKLLRWWGALSFAAFLAFGSWYDHYVTPVLVPLCVLAAPSLSLASVRGRRWSITMLGFGLIACIVVIADNIRRHGTREQAETIATAIDGELRGGCAFVFDGEPAFYRMANSCLPSRYAFPNHLNTWTEARALDVDPNLEVARIMMARPDVVVTAEWWPFYLPNWETRAIVTDFLQRGYERYASVRMGTHQYGLWRRRRT